MRRSNKMEDVEEAWRSLFSLKLSVLFPSCSREAPALICSHNTEYGELLFPKEVAACLLGVSRSDNHDDKDWAVAELNKSLDGFSYPEQFFSEFKLNQKHNLFLRLNRPFIFTNFISHVIRSKDGYGTHVPSERGQSITLVPHTVATRVVDISVSEARTLLTLGLLKNMLMCLGESVTVCLLGLSVSEQTECIGKLLSSFFPITLLPHAMPAMEFIAAFLPLNVQHRDTTLSTGSAHHSLPGNLKVDIKTFAVDHQLIGKCGYDKNLNTVQGQEHISVLASSPRPLKILSLFKGACGGVADDSGQCSISASVARHLCLLSTHKHMLINVALQQLSYQTQQAMILTQMMCSFQSNSSLQQHIALTSAVDVLSCPSTNYSIVELFRVRLKQMATAFSARHSDLQKGDQLACCMTEAVIKFELLSNDPTAYVKLDAPEVSPVSETDADVRFDGAFVLYNYARVATLLSRHQLASEQGLYPPLPNVESVDFSLLKEEEEWQLMFYYVLQYPLMIKEAAKLSKKGAGVHITLGLKKVCQFLTRFSHAFSSYYSRTKVLMSPESHLLPLIHARLYLMKTIKQVMHNGLTLLAIEPAEQL